MEPMKHQVLLMIAQLQARLQDLEDVVRSYEGDLSGYDEKLDRIDDKVYLLELSLTKAKEAPLSQAPAAQAASSHPDAPEAPAAEGSSTAPDAESGSNAPAVDNPAGDADLTPAQQTVQDLNVIYQEGRETFGELKEALDDITSVFGNIGGGRPSIGRDPLRYNRRRPR